MLYGGISILSMINTRYKHAQEMFSLVRNLGAYVSHGYATRRVGRFCGCTCSFDVPSRVWLSNGLPGAVHGVVLIWTPPPPPPPPSSSYRTCAIYGLHFFRTCSCFRVSRLLLVAPYCGTYFIALLQSYCQILPYLILRHLTSSLV